MEKFEKIITDDGSISFYNHEFNESYHSKTGAIEESFLKFVKPAISLLNLDQDIKVLDLFFGLGYNSFALLYYLREINKYNKQIYIKGVEIDKEIYNQNRNIVFTKDILFDNLIIESKKANFYYEKVKEIDVKFEDVFLFLDNLNDKFDLVFFDAFSIKRQPELWSLEMFEKIRKISKNNTILTTYSCSKTFRNNISKQGFTCYDGPCIGRKSPSTICKI